MSTIIRPRNETDLPSCASLLARVYASDGYPVQGVSHAIEFLSPPSTLAAWVAEDISSTATTDDTQPKDTQQPQSIDKKILGHVSLSTPSPSSTDPAVILWRSQHQFQSSSSPKAEVLVLERLFVDPSARGHGLAAKLLSAASEEAGRLGLRVVLFTLVKDQGAMRLYERVGWREFGRRVFAWRDGDGEGEGEEREMEAVCFVGPGGTTSADE
jgi:ribosomal protein S18 acetylase RimI-like enzyme